MTGERQIHLTSATGFGADFQFTLLTDDPDCAEAADAAGIDRVGLDIEQLGKTDRQGPELGARLSCHRLEDLERLKGRVRKGRLFCRLDPPHEGTRAQIEDALRNGARSLMLPFFHEVEQAEAFVEAIDGRAETLLLVETAPAAWRIDALARIGGVDEIMVGLNDLSMDCRMASRFELLISPLMAAMSEAVRGNGKRFAVGGLGRWTDTELPTPPDLVYAQYPRLGAQGAWLARSFVRDRDQSGLSAAVQQARRRLDHWASQDAEALEEARRRLEIRVREP
jgi:hypothetical protein